MTALSKRTRCRSCFAPDLRTVIDFGPQPLAGFYSDTLEGSLSHARYPLVLEACPHCDLLQITDLPPIEQVFHADYSYASSQIPPLVEHFARYAHWLTERLPADASILEFGCNDGVLLEQLRKVGFERLCGVDASPNMAALARARGLDIVEGFFNSGMVQELTKRGPFDLITCSNVFAHVDDVQDVLHAAHALLDDDGQLCIEVHDAERLILENQFETIYHEHLTYFSAASLGTCLELNGFEPVEIRKTQMHGGGLRMRARKAEEGKLPAQPRARSASEIARIGRSLKGKIDACRREVATLCAQYGPLDAYGMAGRAQMFLTMTNTESAFGTFFDDAAIRQGRFVVGTDKRIAAFATERAARACVILAWNYAEAILARIEPHYDAIHVMFPEMAKLK